MARQSSFEADAREMAERIERAAVAGEQLVLLPELTGEDGSGEGDAGGAVRRGKGKAQSTLRDWLAVRGMRMPEDVLAELAGLSSGQDAFVTAMARAEQLVAWQFDGAVRIKPNGEQVEAKPTASARMEAFKTVFGAMLRAGDSLLPYGLGKVTPDVAVHQSTTIVMPGAAAAAQGDGSSAHVVGSRRMGPPPMPGEVVEHQQVSGGDDE